MNRSERIFRMNVGFFINQPIGYNRDIPFEVEHHSFNDTLIVDDLKGNINLNRTQTGLRVQADFEAKTGMECGRCLENFDFQLTTHFEEIFTFENQVLSEDEAIIPEDGNVDFEPYIRDYLTLEIPINPICKPDCQGLCDICGANLNVQQCGHEHVRPDVSAFAKLSQLSEENTYSSKNVPIINK